MPHFFVFTNDRFTENRNEIQSIINKRYYLFLRLALHKINNKFVFGAASRQPDKEYHQSQTFRVCIKERLTLKTDRIGKRCIRIFALSVLSDDRCAST